MPGASAKCLDRKFLDADQLLDWPLLMQWTAPATGIACRLLAISGLFVGVSGRSALPQKADIGSARTLRAQTADIGCPLSTR
jgi:hypothetical protein